MELTRSRPRLESNQIITNDNLHSTACVFYLLWSGHQELNLDSKLPKLSGYHTPPTLLLVVRDLGVEPRLHGSGPYRLPHASVPVEEMTTKGR